MIKVGDRFRNKSCGYTIAIAVECGNALYSVYDVNDPKNTYLETQYALDNYFDPIKEKTLDKAMRQIRVKWEVNAMEDDYFGIDGLDLGSSTPRKDHKGEFISSEEWDKLYCACNARKPKVLRIENKLLKVCINCKKEII